MKFFVRATIDWGAMGIQEQVERVQAAVEWYKRAKAAGTVDVTYGFASGGGFSIVNAETVEDLYEALLSYPIPSHWEIEPLIDMERVGRVVQKAWKSA